MESHPYTKTRGVGPVTTQLTPGAEPASWKSVGAPGPWSCSLTCRAWSESSRPSFTDSISTGSGCTCRPCNTGAGSTCSPCNTGAGCTCSPCNTGAGCTCSPCNTGAGCTCRPCNTGAGSTWSPCNNCWATPSAFLHKQLDVTSNDPMARVPYCELQSAQRQVSRQRRRKATSLQCETIAYLVLIQAPKEARDVDL